MATCWILSISLGQDFTAPMVEIAPANPTGHLQPDSTIENSDSESSQVSETWPASSEIQNDEGLRECYQTPEGAEHSFDLGYDNGLYFRATEGKDSFELKTNIRSQLRFVNFSRSESSWTDSAGEVSPIDNRRYFGARIYTKAQVSITSGQRYG
jgi:hypothetical protein